jgi:hypothetical protein
MGDLGVQVQETTATKALGLTVGQCEYMARLAEEALPVGRFVVQGTDDHETALPAASTLTETGLGIVAEIAPREDGTTAGTFDSNEAVNIVTKGRVWVTVEDAVSAGQSAFVRFTADSDGAGDATRPVGNFRSDADTDEAVELPESRFETSTSGAGLALLYINLP